MIRFNACPQRESLKYSSYTQLGCTDAFSFAIDVQKGNRTVRTEIVVFDPFQNARPCWLSKLRQIALVEAAEELNENSLDYFGRL